MKIITSTDAKDFYPNSIDIALATAKGLANDGTLTDYYYVQSLYYYYLEYYLTNILEIRKAEQEITDYSAHFEKVPTEEEDLYQSLSSNKYFYIRNTLYVENLNKEDILTILNSNPTVVTNEIIELIKRTMKSVITQRHFEAEDGFYMNYGPLEPDYTHPNNSLIMGIRFAEEDDSLYESEDAWFDDYTNRRAYIENKKKELAEQWSKTLGIDTRVVEYFEQSIKKKPSNGYVMQ